MRKLISAGSIGTPVTFYKMHSHHFWEFVYYTTGNGTITIGDESFPFEGGSIYAIPPNVPHKDEAENGYTNLYIIFVDGDMEETHFHFDDTPTRDVYKILSILLREHMMQVTGHEAIIESLLQTALVYAKVLTVSSNEIKNATVEMMKQIILNNFTDMNFNLKQMNETTRMNPDYARRLFVKYTGMTPISFLRSLRIKKAKELLIRAGQSNKIGEIAYQCGFSDQYHFSRFFKEVTGESPSEWKKQNMQK